MTIRYIHPVKANTAQDLVAQIYVQIKRDFGSLVEPFTLHSPSPKLLAGVWMICRETELAGKVSREIKEAVATSISKTNQCPYCVDAHTIMLNATGKRSLARLISNENYDQISDSEVREIVEWALATRSPRSATILSPPFSRGDAPEIIGTTVFFHYINRMAIVFLGETPLPSNNKLLKNILKSVASLFFSRAVRRPKSFGASLKFLAEAELPADLKWAETNSTIADAFARFSAVVDEAGMYALPAEVRTCVQEHIQEWNGEDPGPNGQWVEQAIKGFTETSKITGRLALLAAFAPHKIDERLILAFRTNFPEDDRLVGAIAWASFLAARRIGTWLDFPK